MLTHVTHHGIRRKAQQNICGFQQTCGDDYSRWNHAILDALEASEALEALVPPWFRVS